ncbi:MAG: agmatine deiminase family protein [Bacteroidota bacterium]
MKGFLLLLLSFTFSLCLPGQEISRHYTKGTSRGMPYRATSGTQNPEWKASIPSQPLRAMAEWEEVEYLVLAWTQHIPTLTQIVKHAQRHVKVLIICKDSAEVCQYLGQCNIPIENVHFLEAAFNSIWVRDYGGYSVYADEVGERRLADWMYNRPRPLDDQIPRAISQFLHIPLYEMSSAPWNLVHTGGNFLTDGMGTGFSSELVLQENMGHETLPKSVAEIELAVQKFMGIHRYITMPILPYDGIHHIDMHMKLLDEETILLGAYPKGISNGPQIEANLQYMVQHHLSPYGRPYKVIRIPMPPDNGYYPPAVSASYRTYTNAVILNQLVLVPLFEEKYDTTALRIYREAMPGYEIVGIDCKDVIESGGALHCITNTIGVADPLRITHKVLSAQTNDQNAYEIQAQIQHQSGIRKAYLYYTSGLDMAFKRVPMERQKGSLYLWTGHIPAQVAPNQIYYYISAESQNGKRMQRPVVGEEGPWKFEILSEDSHMKEENFQPLRVERVEEQEGEFLTCLEIHNPVTERGTIHILNAWGRKVKSLYRGRIPRGTHRFYLNQDDFDEGVYTLVIDKPSNRIMQELTIR